jgi:hypothetical protein
MSTLFREQCVACRRDSPRVTEAEIAELRRDVSAWQLLERDGIARLERVFHFPNFTDALGFTNQVGALAEREATIPPSSPSGGVSRSPGGPTKSVAFIGTTSSWPRRPMWWPLRADTKSDTVAWSFENRWLVGLYDARRERFTCLRTRVHGVGEALALDISKLAQSLPEGLQLARGGGRHRR